MVTRHNTKKKAQTNQKKQDENGLCCGKRNGEERGRSCGSDPSYQVELPDLDQKSPADPSKNPAQPECSKAWIPTDPGTPTVCTSLEPG